MEQFGITERQLLEEFTFETILRISKINELREKKRKIDEAKARMDAHR
jgi:hypothetical protein